MASAVILPLYLLSQKAPKVGSVIFTIFVVAGTLLIAGLVLLLLYGLVRSIFADA